MRLAAAVLLFGPLLLAGCGEEEMETGGGAGLPPAGGAGILTYALPELPATLDPLEAATREAQLVTRQVHEPLVATASGPYEGSRRPAGLAESLKPSPDRTVWRVTLRTGVRFQDGTPFNAAAVLANSRRWSARPEGRSLLPGLFAVDAPRPDEVRFLFGRPLEDLPRRLASPRLGIVAPPALEPRAGGFHKGARGTGTGPFQAGTRSQARLELSRYPQWWGSLVGLGPALDAASFVRAPAEAERLRLLRSGEAQVVEPLGRAAAALTESDPLLTSESIGGVNLGLEASVRGLEAGSGVLALSGVWFTRIGG